MSGLQKKENHLLDGGISYLHSENPNFILQVVRSRWASSFYLVKPQCES